MNQLKQIIEGKTSVKVETQSPIGKEYNTNTPELKPTRITTANGDVYGFVKKSETSDLELGELKEGVITVEYVYRKVMTTYVDEEGKEINPSDKGTKDKKEISGYTFKETKKDKDGNTTHVYRQVITSYVDEKGKEINPSDKGTKNKKDIPEYIYKETKKDKDGNTIHVYRKNPKPAEPTKPVEPTKPAEPTKPVEPTKRLANTGTTETNTGLAGLGLGILGGLLAAARRRKNDKN